MTVNQHGYGDIRLGLIPEDLLKFSWAEEIALDPSGQIVAYTIRRPHPPSNGYDTQLYLHHLKEQVPCRLTSGQGNASSLAWSNDGRRLAYAWNDAKGNSVRVWSANSDGEAVYPLGGEAMSSLDWSADGTRLAGVRWTPMPDSQGHATRAGVPAPSFKVVRRLRYKQDGVGWVHDRFMQIWVLELSSGDLQQITSSECDFMEPKWSHNGHRLAYIGLAREQNIELGQGQIFICDYPGGTPYRLLPDWQGACRSPVWGEDDRVIAFAGHTHPAPVNRRVFFMPYAAEVATGTARALAPELDQEVGNYGVADQRKSLTNITLKWPANNPWIYFLLTVEGATHLYRVNTAGLIERLVDGPKVVFEYSPARDNLVAYGLADPANPGDIYAWHPGGPQRLTDLNPWLRDHRLAEPKDYWYDVDNGDKVHAWIMTPPDLDESRKYPAVVYVHCSMFSWDFNHEFQCLANAGYVVAYFNQHGTTAGYGQAWTRASEGDQGGTDYQEIMLGVDDLLKRGYIDEQRLGVTGGSCGGFMTNWIVGHTDRFAAAVTQRSIVNQISFFGTSDIGPECTQGETGHNPWSSLESLWQQSPLAYAANVRTPLLIIHSDEDYRCAVEQAEQLFAALRWHGREVELVIFEGENHGLSRGGRPGNRIERLRRILGWFEKYLGISPAYGQVFDPTA